MIELPFFTPEHRDLAKNVAEFAAREIEPHGGVEDDVEGLTRRFVSLLAGAGLLKYAVAEAQLDTRSQKLEMLIQEADEKIAALERARAAGTSSSPSSSRDEREAWTIQAEPARSEPETDIIDPRHQQVYELADQGTAAADIARQLDRPRGEIELILALRPRTRT